MGPISVKEKLLALFFILAILGWATGSLTKIDTAAVALGFFGLAIIFELISWETVLKNRGAWSTFIWFGGVVGISNALASAGFFKWLAAHIQPWLNFSSMSPVLAMFILLVFSLAVRYLFASMSAYIVAFIPVLFTVGLAAKVPPYPFALLLAYGTAYGSVLTHYGGSVGPVLFGTGYVDQATWWKVGAVIVATNVVVYMSIGLPIWSLMGLW
jgi:DASS family divalent anion:Na+ symporter